MLNQQITGDGLEVYFNDVKIDGEFEDFSRDPRWEGRGNNVEFEERAIRPMHDFGYSQTQHAGRSSGEIGGIIWRDEQPAYYGDKVGPFSLDDALTASGKVAFTGAGSDSGIYFGWFDSTSKRNKTTPDYREQQKNILGIAVEGPSRIGHYFRPVLYTAGGKECVKSSGPIIRPDGKVHDWSLHYAPEEAGGDGRITMKFDDVIQTFDLQPGARQTGATFDRFGLFNMQTGGHYVYIYIDDLTYSKGRVPK
jgi:hypothetical protein